MECKRANEKNAEPKNANQTLLKCKLLMSANSKKVSCQIIGKLFKGSPLYSQNFPHSKVL